MLKALVIVETSAAKKLIAKLQDNTDIKIVATLNPNEYDPQQHYNADIIITNDKTLAQFLHGQPAKQTPRQHIKAITHQGIRLVPLTDIYYFQAEHKYVTAFHTRGQLLIEDSLNGLEKEFAELFLRIHRKTLVAKAKIEDLFKKEDNQFYIKLRDIADPLKVSRRQLATVRKEILCL